MTGSFFLKQRSFPAAVLFPVLGIFCLLLEVSPFFPLPALFPHIPFVLGIVFYFGLYKGTLSGNFWSFFLGMSADLIMGTPFGLQAFLFSLLFFVVSLNRRLLLRFPFYLTWIVFGVVSFCVYALFWVLFFLKTGFAASLIPLFPSYLLLILTYPFIATLCVVLDEWTERMR